MLSSIHAYLHLPLSQSPLPDNLIFNLAFFMRLELEQFYIPFILDK